MISTNVLNDRVFMGEKSMNLKHAISSKIGSVCRVYSYISDYKINVSVVPTVCACKGGLSFTFGYLEKLMWCIITIGWIFIEYKPDVGLNGIEEVWVAPIASTLSVSLSKHMVIAPQNSITMSLTYVAGATQKQVLSYRYQWLHGCVRI